MRRSARLLPAAMLLAVLLTTVPVEAGAILYNLTDLGGSGYRFQTNADGSDYGLTSNSTGITYAFDKAPTTTIEESSSTYDLSRAGTTLTLQSGAYKVGYSADINPNDAPNTLNGAHYSQYPSFEPPKNDWIGGSSQYPMIWDMNTQGQVVGAGVRPGTDIDNGLNYFAAFSAPGLQPHGGQASIVDNLNNYIAAQPGMSLLFSNGIDDLGRILAFGSDGHEYLLTPEALGTAATVPEPTTLATLGLSTLAWLAYALRHRTCAGR